MRRFVLGQNQSRAQNQFKINPKLQRTKAGDPTNRQGLTLGTFIFNYPTLQNGQVVLPNRAVPQNMNFVKRRRVPRNIINPIQVPTERSKGNFEN